MASSTDPIDAKARHLAEGEAALFLMETLLLTLVTKGLLGRDEVVQSIENLVDVKRDMAENGHAPGLSKIAAGILIGVANTISAAERI